MQPFMTYNLEQKQKQKDGVERYQSVMQELTEMLQPEEESKRKPEELVRGWTREEKMKCGLLLVKELVRMEPEEGSQRAEVEAALKEMER